MVRRATVADPHPAAVVRPQGALTSFQGYLTEFDVQIEVDVNELLVCVEALASQASGVAASVVSVRLTLTGADAERLARLLGDRARQLRRASEPG